MSLFDRLLRRKALEAIAAPLVDGLFLPRGCIREWDTLVVLPEYSNQWFAKYPDKKEAVKQMLAHLKQQYPAVLNFQVRK